MDKISFLKSIKAVEYNDKGELVAVKDFVQRSSGDME